jgi:predicted deacylase
MALSSETQWSRRRLQTADADVGVDTFEQRPGPDGPAVVVLAGVHGDEPTGTAAALSLLHQPPRLTRGSLTVAPVCNEAAWAAATREHPNDGANLARQFPGRQDGTPSERLAHLLTTKLIARADVLVDLHTASRRNDMAFLAGCYAGPCPLGRESERLARAFGADYVWLHPTMGRGRTLSAAFDLGVPGIYAESPGGGRGHERYVTAYRAGVEGVCCELGLMDGSPGGGRPATVLRGDGDLDMGGARAPTSGIFRRAVAVEARVDAGERLGDLWPLDGGPQVPVAASQAGTVVLLARDSGLAEGDLAAFVAGA